MVEVGAYSRGGFFEGGGQFEDLRYFKVGDKRRVSKIEPTFKTNKICIYTYSLYLLFYFRYQSIPSFYSIEKSSTR